MARILIVSHTPRGTGFGKVAIGIAGQLAAQHTVQLIGVGPACALDAWVGLHSDIKDIGCTSALREKLRDHSTDLLILVGVNVLSAWQAERVRRDGYRGILLAYVPLEGPIGDSSRLQGLRSCTEVVAYHATAALALSTALGASCAVSWIYHAVHHSAPCAQWGARPQRRLNLLPTLASHAERTWMLNANRNDLRKCPEATLQAFATIVSMAPQTTLLMHCNPKRPNMDLRVERDRLGLRDHLIFTQDVLPGSWTDAHLSELYACCEIGLSSSLGEGWGLIPFEHAHQGGAQILPAHAGLQEIWGGAPTWVPVGAQQRVDPVSIGQRLEPSRYAEAMLGVLRDPIRLSENAQACYAHASQAQFSWHAIGVQWHALINRLLQELPDRQKWTGLQKV